MASESIAIDVALLPDETMVSRAKQMNATLLKNYPAGFALDDRHVPHITLLQAFVSRSSLEEIGRKVQGIDVGGELQVVGFGFHDGGDLGAGGFVISRPPWLVQAHCELVASIAPITLPDGDSDAFVTSTDEPSINPQTVDYVKRYLGSRVGNNYHPHLSVGIARTDLLRELQQAGIENFSFDIEGLAVYQLGNFGTCQRLLFRQN